MTWFKDGVALDDKTVGTRTSEVDTILFIRSSERRHSGIYTLCVQIENMSDSADIHIQVVGTSCLRDTETLRHRNTQTLRAAQLYLQR